MERKGIISPSRSKKATILLSGGIDSASCVHFLKQRGFSTTGIFVDYGQPAAKKERNAVDQLQSILDINVYHLKVSSLVDYSTGELVGRNAFLIMSTIFLGGISDGLLAIGIHSGTPYYDCSSGFMERMKPIVEEHTNGNLTILAPFLSWDKLSVYKYFKESGLPLQATYSCELGTIPPCGNCASCKDRRLL
jgi:7-cyano-7-deazaguanine synthase